MTTDFDPAYVASGGSFEELYRREYPQLFGVARALTGDRADSEDLVQDTMVRAFVNWGKVGRYQRPGAWCVRVLTNMCRKRWHRRRTASQWIARQRRQEPTTAAPDPSAMVFWQAVRRLPERPRLVVALYYAGDRPVAEIASRGKLECPGNPTTEGFVGTCASVVTVHRFVGGRWVEMEPIPVRR